jgi:hypothetical protein
MRQYNPTNHLTKGVLVSFLDYSNAIVNIQSSTLNNSGLGTLFKVKAVLLDFDYGVHVKIA